MATAPAPMLRPLTPAERAELHPGLLAALDRAGAAPRISDRPHPFARIAAVWRGGVPILALGRTVFWPGAAADLAATPNMAVLQHELQHILDYATGALTPLGYALLPRNWTYAVAAEPPAWQGLGAEQRAVLAERLWVAQRRDPQAARRLAAIIPWAREADAL